MESRAFRIKTLSLDDIESLKVIGRSTFYESFKDITPEEDMQEYLETSFNTKTLSQELKDKKSIFYFVETVDKIIGYGKINFDRPPYGMAEMPNSMEIQRIYILKEFQGLGAAQKLMNVFFQEEKQRNLNNIWLSTGAFNNKAVNFYRKYGFEKITSHNFSVGNIIYDDVILLLEVR